MLGMNDELGGLVQLWEVDESINGCHVMDESSMQGKDLHLDEMDLSN